MKFPKFFICAVGILAFALPAIAQLPTGTLTGRVDNGTATLPGVLVTVTSPSQQGVRTAVTGVNGDYIFTFLPPGEYKVRFELLQFQTQETTVKINAAQTQTVNATLPQAKVAEEVTVTGAYETISGAANGGQHVYQAARRRTAGGAHHRRGRDRLPRRRRPAARVATSPSRAGSRTRTCGWSTVWS